VPRGHRALAPLPGSASPVRHPPALSSYEGYRDGALPVAIWTTDAAALGRFFDGLLDFPARVIDLRMMSFTLLGGRVHELGGRPSALYAYEGSGGRVLLCQMLLGSLADLPPPDETHATRAFTFQVYRRDSLTAVFWQEGGVLCVLVGAGPGRGQGQAGFSASSACRAASSRRPLGSPSWTSPICSCRIRPQPSTRYTVGQYSFPSARQ
jgi:hypothetical protein